MKHKHIIKVLISCFLILVLICGICSYSITTYASTGDAVIPLIWEDPWEPPNKIQLLRLTENTAININGEWSDTGEIYHSKWQAYNCYAYAIHFSDADYTAGFMNGEYYARGTATVQEVAQIAKNDLETMGYSNVELHNDIPIIDETQELICVRKTTPESRDKDFHYMRYDLNTNSWYHKPGDSAILKYNGVPSDEIDWCNEWVDENGIWFSPDNVYSGKIIYITYSKNIINVGQNTSKSIGAGKEILCEINVNTDDEYDLLLTSTYSTEYRLYNEDLDLLLEGSGASNIAQIELTPGKYYLRINFETYSDSAASVNIKITNIHTHYYTYSYESRSASSHKAYCICGEYIAEAHNIQNTNCVNCGYHKHSYDSSYESANETLHYMYCICGAYALDYHNMVEHECTVCDYSNHSFAYTSIDGSTHSVTCDCGINIVENHDMQNGTCADCGYHVHSYDDHYVAMNDFQHYCYCSCGERTTAMHVISQVGAGAPGSSRVCLICGRVMGSGGTLNGVYTDLPHTENGSYILPNGIIVLVPEDEEAFFNGTLEFRTGEVM